MLILLLPLLACDFSASTDVIVADTGGPTPVDGGADGGGDGGGADGGDADGGGDGGDDPTDPADEDGDLDGYTPNEGDCDDTDGGVHPDSVDGCDGVDEDCDGDVDEDAVDEDPYEPNDSSAFDLGSLQDDGDHSIDAALHTDDDVDRFAFSFEDGTFSFFALDVGLSNIPDDATYQLRVENLSTGELYFDEVGSGSLSTSIGDTLLHEDGGDWEITVSSAGGADCGQRYLLTVGFSE